MDLWQRVVKLEAHNLDTGKKLTIERLEVQFEVTRTLEKEPSTLSATVYNLSETSRSWLESGDRIVLTLSAGYGKNVYSLFVGDLRRVVHRREDADVATDLEAGDGERGAKNWARKWFKPGTSVGTIFSYLIETAEIGKGNLSDGIALEEANGLPDEIRTGLHVRGYALDELNELARSRGIDFSVQNGDAQFLPINDFRRGIPITTITAKSGLIGSPTIDNEGIMSCRTLLLPNIFPGSRVDVKSEFVSGRFKVTRGSYTGSLYGDDFSIDLEAKELV